MDVGDGWLCKGGWLWSPVILANMGHLSICSSWYEPVSVKLGLKVVPAELYIFIPLSRPQGCKSICTSHLAKGSAELMKFGISSGVVVQMNLILIYSCQIEMQDRETVGSATTTKTINLDLQTNFFEPEFCMSDNSLNNLDLQWAWGHSCMIKWKLLGLFSHRIISESEWRMLLWHVGLVSLFMSLTFLQNHCDMKQQKLMWWLKVEGKWLYWNLVSIADTVWVFPLLVQGNALCHLEHSLLYSGLRSCIKHLFAS